MKYYPSLTLCNLLNLSEWAQEDLNDTEAFAWIFFMYWLHLHTKSNGLVFSNHDNSQGHWNLQYRTSSNSHICVWERKILFLITPTELKSNGSFGPFSKAGGSDSQIWVRCYGAGSIVWDTSNSHYYTGSLSLQGSNI